MADVFHSPRLTLKRAEHHIKDFNATIATFREGQPWAEIIDKESKPGYDIHKLRFTGEPPETLPCILFDIANNLRAVLDQCGYASAVCGKSPCLKAVKFPFAPTEEKFRNNFNGGCKDLPTEIKTLFRSCQAYETGNPTLWALNEVANTKKHLKLMALPVGSARANFSAIVGPDGWIGHEGTVPEPDGGYHGWDSDKKEITLVTVPTGNDPRISGHMTFDVAIEGIDILRREPAGKIVHNMRDAVEDVLNRTEAICRRLLFIS